jgi:hypothetical protein
VETRLPDANDLYLIRQVIDPGALRELEVPGPPS